MALSKAQQEAVKSTFEVVAANSDSFAAAFYGHLFEQDQSLRKMFNTDLHEQGQVLFRMLAIAVAGLDHPDDLLPALHDLGLHHAGYGVKPEHYLIFGKVLLRTLNEFVGAAFTPEANEAWVAFYEILSAGAIEGAKEDA